MKQLHQKIEERKRSISRKKAHLERDYKAAKKSLTSGTGLSLTAVGGLVVGFLLLPKKFRILKSVFKAYSMAATLRGFLDVIPHREPAKTRRSERFYKERH